MDRQQQGFTSATGEHQDTGTPASQGKKRYTSPELQEWGSITDLTQGIKLGFEDFPNPGGTRVA